MYGLHFKCIGIRDFTVKTKSMLNLPPPCLTNMGVLSSFLSLRSSRSPLAGRGKMEKEEIIQVLVKNLVLGTGRYSRCQPTVLPKGGSFLGSACSLFPRLPVSRRREVAATALPETPPIHVSGCPRVISDSKMLIN